MATYGLTLLQIVNRVLRRLREEEVAAYNTTAYSTHITDVINQVKNEIEASWYWHALRDTFSVPCTDQVSHYALTNAGANAEIIDGWNTATGQQLARGTNRSFNSKFFGTGSSAIQTGSPTEFLPAGVDTNLDLAVDVWPIPVTGYLDTLKFNVYVPQDDLAASATVPLVPQEVLIEETIARMLVERGEEGAQPAAPGDTFLRRDLLAAAILRDGGTDATEWDWETE
jgi:hypothetical protein